MVKYKSPARALHWIVALLVVAVWPLGAVIAFVRDEAKSGFYMVHESLGFIVLWLMLARLAYRLANPPPPALTTSRLESLVSNSVHHTLYALLILQPVIGFLATNAHGFPLDWFWLLPVPSPIGKSPDIAPLLSALHVAFGWTILALFVLHIAGVLKHHLIHRDATLERMI